MLEMLLLMASSLIGATNNSVESDARQIYSSFNGNEGVTIKQISKKEMNKNYPRAAGTYQSGKREINYIDLESRNLWIILHEFGHDLAPHQELECEDWAVLEEATAYMFADWGLRTYEIYKNDKTKKIRQLINGDLLETWAYGDELHSKGIKLYLETKGRFGKDLISLEKGINYLCDLRKVK